MKPSYKKHARGKEGWLKAPFEIGAGVEWRGGLQEGSKVSDS